MVFSKNKHRKILDGGRIKKNGKCSIVERCALDRPEERFNAEAKAKIIDRVEDKV